MSPLEVIGDATRAPQHTLAACAIPRRLQSIAFEQTFGSSQASLLGPWPLVLACDQYSMPVRPRQLRHGSATRGRRVPLSASPANESCSEKHDVCYRDWQLLGTNADVVVLLR